MFINSQNFAVTSFLEANWRAIRDEYLNLPEDIFEPWIECAMYGTGMNSLKMFKHTLNIC